MNGRINISRYSAYYRGWCQAFGEFEGEPREGELISWIYNDDAVGFIFKGDLFRRLLRNLLGKDGAGNEIQIAQDEVRIGDELMCFQSELDRLGIARLRALLGQGREIHMFLTSHFYFSTGSRILTFSAKKPLPIIYKELAPISIRY